MSQEISGVSDALPIGNDTLFEETGRKKGHSVPSGSSTVSTIQPHVDHRVMPQSHTSREGTPLVSNKSKKSYWITLFLIFITGLIGGHDLYTGNIGKFIIKLFVFPPTLLISLLCPPMFLVLFSWPIFDFYSLCNGTYKDGYGKCV